MKNMWLIITVLVLMVNSCNGQKQDSTKDKENALKAPKTNITVNKEYDKNGNLIRYDSTYSYVYSNFGKDNHLKDSVFNEFMNTFHEQYPFSENSNFNHLFFQDSLLKYDFFKDDFFTQRFRRNIKEAEKMFREMDSIKNKFYLKNK